MFRLGAVLALVVVVISQPGGGPWHGFGDRFQQWYSDTVDTFHEFRFVEHSNNTSHLLIAIHDDRDRAERTCFAVVVDRAWEVLLTDKHTEELMIEEIYKIIRDPTTPSRRLDPDELEQLYGDTKGSRECRGHMTKLIAYMPSDTVQDSFGHGGTHGGTTTARVRPIGK